MYDPELYRDKAEVERWRHRDPIELLARRMREAGAAHDDQDVAAIEDTLARQIEASVAAARAAPAEPVEDLTTFVYSPESS